MNPSLLTAILDAEADRHRAEQLLAHQIRAAFPIGSPALWRWSASSGISTGNFEHIRYDAKRVRVFNDRTGKSLWIGTSKILPDVEGVHSTLGELFDLKRRGKI